MQFNQIQTLLVATIIGILTTGGRALINSLDDNICEVMAKEGKCETQPKVTLEFCAKACDDLVKSKAYYNTVSVDDDASDEFYDLKARNWTGATVNFSEFDGYVSGTPANTQVLYIPSCQLPDKIIVQHFLILFFNSFCSSHRNRLHALPILELHAQKEKMKFWQTKLISCVESYPTLQSSSYFHSAYQIISILLQIASQWTTYLLQGENHCTSWI